MIVRPVRPEEHERVGALTVTAYHALPGHVVEPDYDDELRDVAAKLAAGCEVMVASTDDGAVLGAICFVPATENRYYEFPGVAGTSFRHLAVDPAVQRAGIGRALVGWVIARSRALGAPRLLLHTTPWMTGAHRLYESLGFRRAPQHDATPVPEVPLLGFELELAPIAVELERVTWAVERLEAMVAFLGGAFGARFEQIGGSPLWRGTLAGLDLVLCPNELAGVDARQNRHQLRLVVDDVDAVVAGGQAMDGEVLHDVFEGGRRVVGLRDPDGNTYEIAARKA